MRFTENYRTHLWAGVLVALASLSHAASSPSADNLRKHYEDASGLRLCPDSCADTGSNPSNWTSFQDAQNIALCNEKIKLLEFSIHTSLDNPDTNAFIRSCVSVGGESIRETVLDLGKTVREIFNNGSSKSMMIRRDAPFSNTVLLPITPTLSYSPSTGNVVRGQVLGALQELQYYLLQQDDLSDDSNTTAIFAHYGDSVVGLYVGGQFQKRLLAATLLQQVFGFVKQDGQFDSLIVQACGPTTPSDFTVGLVVDTRGLKAFSAAQNALRQWSGAQCVSGVGVSRSFEQVLLPMAPDNAGILRKLSADSSNHTGSRNTSASLYPRARLGHSHLHRRADCRTTKVEAGDGCWAVANRCGVSEANLSRYNGGGNFCTTLQPNQQVCCSEGTLPSNGPPQNSDGTCSTKKVDGGDSCASLATKCGVSGADFTKFNSGTTNLCSTLRVGQLVCCSTGKLPDIRPKPNPDGSCATYTVKQDDWCDKIAAAHGLTLVQLESFNKGTWGFTGCTNLFVDVKLCVSSGTPPMPEPISNANCGPQKPNTVAPSDRSLASLASLNPCPLNACCNIWGQCGTTAEFCTVTGKGGPGTVAPGTNGCISNCGMDIVNNDKPPAQFRRVGYFEAWNKERLCLHMDVEKIDKSRFTHIHFAFVDITPTFEVDTSKVQEQFDKFVKLQGVQRIVAFGGWEASTNPSSYWIFREGVKTANRVKLATNIANFIRQFNLDGVDFDWEYPAAPDIPGIPAGDAVDGPLYRDFLALMRARIGSGKSLSIAAPASHWYLKGMPIEAISRTVDYIVYMTYDLHGQWDAGNPWSSPGCPGGNCLRSHINMTETLNALSMVTKAGVPSAKLLIGVTSYGRSFQMSDPNCSGPQCTFTGDHKESFAMKGWCTGTAGYISDAEINGIISSGRFTGVRKFTDDTESNIVVFNGNNWVAYMDAANKASRIERYRGLNFGGISDWAVDLESFSPLDRGHPGVFFEHRPPDGGQFEKLSWWNMTCGHGAVGETDKLTKQERWDALDTNTAWKWVIDAWKNERAINPNRLPFTSFISDRFNGPSRMQCQLFDGANNCRQTLTCDVFKGSVHKPTGPAAYLITNAIISLHQFHSNFYDSLDKAKGDIDATIGTFTETFAPTVKESMDLAAQIVLNLINFGTSMFMGPFYNNFFKFTGTYSKRPGSWENLKEGVVAGVNLATASGKDVLAAGGAVPGDTKDKLGFVLQKTFDLWRRQLEVLNLNLFQGLKDEYIDTLWTFIRDAKFNEGLPGETNAIQTEEWGDPERRHHISKAMYMMLIPAAWDLRGITPVVLDTGYACNYVGVGVGDYVEASTAEKTRVCVDHKLYYLVDPDGWPLQCEMCGQTKFSAVAGMDSLKYGNWNGVTRGDLAASAVEWHKKKGNRADWSKPPDLSDGETARFLFDFYADGDFKVPGTGDIPVCSPKEAIKNWAEHYNDNPRWPEYPCNKP